MKKILLIVAVAAAFLIGYAGSAKAWPVYGRNEFYGYFNNIYDDQGNVVINGGIPTSINSANEFINFIEGKLRSGRGTWDGVSAAFIIQTMIGSARNNPPTAAQIADWESRVRAADANGWINWNTTVSYQLNSFYQGDSSGPNPNDDAFFDDGVTKTDTGIRFTDGTKTVYQLRFACGNPVGVVSPLAVGAKFSITGTSSVSDTTVVPGQTITFTHKLTNSGPDRAPAETYNVFQGATNKGSGTVAVDVLTRTVNTNNFTVPNGALPGTRYCQYVHYTPVNQKGGAANSVDACATVIANFGLTPTVSASATATGPNNNVTFSYKVVNSGPSPSGLITTCKAAGGTHPPGYTPLPAADADRNPNTGFNLGCPSSFPLGTTTLSTETVAIGALNPGSRVCRSLVVNPKDAAGGFRASAEACVVIAKAPYVYFLGNDVWAGGDFADVDPACNGTATITTSSTTLTDGTVVGSQVEYAAFALGKITNFGSAAKAMGTLLTFSNTGAPNLGDFGAPQHCITDYAGTYNTLPVTAQPTVIDVNQGSTSQQINNDHTFHGTVPNGSQQVWLVNGDVTIDGDIKYADNYNSVADIPSLVIITTGDILVQHNVKQMDGLFVTEGTFNTCSDAPSGNLSTNDCNNQLNVNGAVIANLLNLLRTYGADGATDATQENAAEQFDFNAEMYLRSALNDTSTNSLRIMSQKDLPPRY